MKNIILLVGTILGTFMAVVGLAYFLSAKSGATASVPANPELVSGGARWSRGPAEAKVTVVEFSDLQCPACRAVQPAIAQVINKYPDQVRVIFRHFPLKTIHTYAQLAAQAAEAAGEQDKFWEMHDLLFNRQPEWSELDSADAVKSKFIQYVSELGIDSQRFSETIDSDKVRQAVQIDVDDATALNLNSTPTLFVNNQLVPAPQNLLKIVEQWINQ